MLATYPDITITHATNEVTISTFVRKKYNGVYYKCLITQCYTGRDYNMLFKRFQVQVYLFQICGVVDTDLILIASDGSELPACIVDEDQTEEAERLIKLYGK